MDAARGQQSYSLVGYYPVSWYYMVIFFKKNEWRGLAGKFTKVPILFIKNQSSLLREPEEFTGRLPWG